MAKGEDLINEILAFDDCDKFWNTPNTYGTNFMVPPKASGIYLYLGYRKLFPKISKHELVYIGSSKNLYQRHCSHNIRPLIERDYRYMQFYFKLMPDGYRDIEVALIKYFKPKYNLQHTRG